jgi:hypothetical protein
MCQPWHDIFDTTPMQIAAKSNTDRTKDKSDKDIEQKKNRTNNNL